MKVVLFVHVELLHTVILAYHNNIHVTFIIVEVLKTDSLQLTLNHSQLVLVRHKSKRYVLNICIPLHHLRNLASHIFLLFVIRNYK